MPVEEASFAFTGIETSFRFRADPTCDIVAPGEGRKGTVTEGDQLKLKGYSSTRR